MPVFFYFFIFCPFLFLLHCRFSWNINKTEFPNFKTCSVWICIICAGVVAVSNLTLNVSEGKQARCPNYCKTKEESVWICVCCNILLKHGLITQNLWKQKQYFFFKRSFEEIKLHTYKTIRLNINIYITYIF